MNDAKSKLSRYISETHPLWETIRMSIVGAVMVAMCAILYKNGLDPKDIILIAGTITSVLGVKRIGPQS